jgi:hypothetical protein
VRASTHTAETSRASAADTVVAVCHESRAKELSTNDTRISWAPTPKDAAT